MMTQTAQALSTHLGFSIPRKIEQANLIDTYQHAMEEALETYDSIYQFDPSVASYIVPNGFKRRVLLTFNLRSAFHFINLRAAPNAHFSIRRIAQRIADEISKVSPILTEYINRPEESWQQIEREYFTKV